METKNFKACGKCGWNYYLIPGHATLKKTGEIDDGYTWRCEVPNCRSHVFVPLASAGPMLPLEPSPRLIQLHKMAMEQELLGNKAMASILREMIAIRREEEEERRAA